ncbi:thiopeptide-type bacteriocin biosynthesis protein [Pontimicrobium sp. MEBiC06410]
MSNNVQSKYILGDHWIYYKIYLGPKTSDAILTEIIKPISEKFISNNIIDKWFFIRYNDPKYHLRLRLYCIEKENIGIVINEFHQQLKEYTNQGLIWKVQLDTYLRELSRYGSNTIELAENLFYYESKMVVDFIDMIEGEEGEELRWLFAMKAINSFLDSFLYSTEQKLELLNDLKIGYAIEFGKTKFLGKQLNDKYRIERDKIEDFISFKSNEKPDYEPIIEVLQENVNNTKEIVSAILKIKEENNLEPEINDLMASYIHMLMNRIFKSKNRLNEMVCYDFLSRFYNSKIAKEKRNIGV